MRAGRAFAGRSVPLSSSCLSLPCVAASRQGWSCCGHRAPTCRVVVVDPARCFVGNSVGRSGAEKGCRLPGSSSSVQATQGSTTTIPVESSQFLGLRAGDAHTDAEIQTAYDKLVGDELEPGYSSATVEGRLEVLGQAKKDCMKSSKNFLTPKNSPEGVKLEDRLVPPALALLCQVGEHDVVIDVGEKLSDDTEISSDVRIDNNLSMGLAKLGQAEAIFNDKMSTSCLKMEEAHQLLMETGCPPAATELIANIEECLLDYAPQSVKQQLMLPLSPERQQDRVDAIEILKDLMAEPGKSSRRLFDRPIDRHFVKEALDSMTSEEILTLMDWAPKIKEPKKTSWYYPGLLLKVSMAHIVVGFNQRKPSVLTDLDKIFSIPGKETEAHVERVVCHVLLGEPDKAIALLDKMEGDTNKGKGHSSAAGGYVPSVEGGAETSLVTSDTVVAAKELPARNETLTFIRANSPAPDEGEQETLLAGLCLFTERWLARIAMPHFRDTCDRQPPPSLDEYFEDERISDFLQDRKSEGPSGDDPEKREGDGDDDGDEEQEEEEETSSENSVSTVAEAVENNGSVSAKKAADPERKKGSSENGKEDDQAEGKKEGEEGKKEAGGGGWQGQLQAFITPSHPRERPNPLVVALAGGAVLGVALFAYVYQPWVEDEEIATLTEAQQATMKKLSTHSPMTTTMAENLVKKWQFAKAKALGQDHEVKFIAKILSSELLDDWKGRVDDVMKQQLHWTHKLIKCKVSDVDSTQFEGGFGHINIHVQLSESASMHDAKGRTLDKHKTAYKVIYEVILDSEGKWRISQINVLRQ